MELTHRGRQMTWRFIFWVSSPVYIRLHAISIWIAGADHYNEIKGISICEFLPPHGVIYVDQPAEEVQKKLKQSGKVWLWPVYKSICALEVVTSLLSELVNIYTCPKQESHLGRRWSSRYLYSPSSRFNRSDITKGFESVRRWYVCTSLPFAPEGKKNSNKPCARIPRSRRECLI